MWRRAWRLDQAQQRVFQRPARSVAGAFVIELASTLQPPQQVNDRAGVGRRTQCRHNHNLVVRQPYARNGKHRLNYTVNFWVGDTVLACADTGRNNDLQRPIAMIEYPVGLVGNALVRNPRQLRVQVFP